MSIVPVWSPFTIEAPSATWMSSMPPSSQLSLSMKVGFFVSATICPSENSVML